jgi:hypothetical protein
VRERLREGNARDIGWPIPLPSIVMRGSHPERMSRVQGRSTTYDELGDLVAGTAKRRAQAMSLPDDRTTDLQAAAVAAALAGAVIVVVGYATGLGLSTSPDAPDDQPNSASEVHR